MSWVTIIWSMIASASLTLAAMHLLVWCKKRMEWASLLFSVAAAAIAAIAFCELCMMRAETPEQFATAVRWLHVPVWVMLVAIVGFVRIRLRAGRTWLAWGVCAIRTFSLLLNFVTGQNLNYRQITALKHVRFFGESVSVADGVSNSWMLIGQLSLLLFVVFVTDATITVWRRGERRQAMATGGAIAFFALAGAVQAILITWQIAQVPLTVSLFYMGFIAVVACEMSSEMGRAMILSADLRDSEERLNLALDAANAGAWSMDVQSNQVWVSASEREMFGFLAVERLTFDRFVNVIHPDDRESVRTAVEKALRTKAPLFVEYRFTRPDGSVRWIAARGHHHCNVKGELDRLMGVSVDITERKRAERQLEERLEFETLLTEFSAGLMNSPPDQVDRMIEDTQRRVCQCLGLDLSALWQVVVGNPGILTLTHVYRPMAGPPLPEPMDAQEYFPWCQGQLMAGKLIAVSSMEETPAEAARDRETWRRYGIKTTLTIPLAAGGGPTFGALSFNDMKKERQWAEALIKQLELVAQIFANAIVRTRSERALRDSEERLNLATDAAGVGLWSMDLKTHRVWVTPKLRELFNFASDREINYEDFFEVIHPKDNDVVRRTVDRALQRKEELRVDYRVVLPDGGIRWIGAHGRPYFNSSGELVRLMGVALDITDRMQQEESLRLSQARVSSAIDIAGLGFYESGENGRVAFMDDRVRALLGLPPEEEPCGREYWLAHIHPEDLPQVLQVSTAILGGHLSSHAMEYRYGHPSRGILWFRHLSRVLERDTAGRSMRTIGVVWDITERKRNEMELLESRGALRTFASRLLTIQDEERRRLARELHDDFTQRLAVLAMEISTIETSAGSAKANPLPALKRIREQIVKLSSDIHDISRQLHPSIIDDLGLTRAIQSECGNFTRRTGIAVSCESISIPSTIPRDVSVGLFRIAQEALRNVEKHARVKEADVLLAGSGESITLTIHDSGTGFDPASAGQSHGLGLFSMKERAQLINGLFSLDSAPGQGTLIRVAVPLEGIEHG